MAETIPYSGALVVEVCWCGIAHAIPSQLQRHAKNDSSFSVYCPLGHRWSIRKSDADRLREELEAEKRRTATQTSRLDQARAERDAERRSHTATKGALTKTRKRVANGVCPCCHRSFVQLARHMKTKHPDFTDTP